MTDAFYFECGVTVANIFLPLAILVGFVPGLKISALLQVAGRVLCETQLMRVGRARSMPDSSPTRCTTSTRGHTNGSPFLGPKRIGIQLDSNCLAVKLPGSQFGTEAGS